MQLTHRRTVGLGLMLWISLCVTGCERAGGPQTPSDGFDRNALLLHLATEALVPTYQAFASESAELVTATAAYCGALEQAQSEPSTDVVGPRATARLAWKEASATWQHAEAMLVGPAAMDDKLLRNQVYAWPLLSPCGLDRDTVSRWQQPDAYDVDSKLINVRSLSAVEYLLFAETTTHQCPMAPVGWDVLGDALPLARCRLAEVLATDIAAKATVLMTAWQPTGGNYVAELAQAGREGSSLPSAQEAVNLVSDGLFYADKMVKDMKLAEAAGIAVNACGTVGTPCMREVEASYADHGIVAIRRNLEALQWVFTGTTPRADGPGFEEFLRARGGELLADQMVQKLAHAQSLAEALPDSYLAALTDDYPAVVELHGAVDSFTDDLKSQFLTVLALDIPDDVAADND